MTSSFQAALPHPHSISGDSPYFKPPRHYPKLPSAFSYTGSCKSCTGSTNFYCPGLANGELVTCSNCWKCRERWRCRVQQGSSHTVPFNTNFLLTPLPPLSFPLKSSLSTSGCQASVVPSRDSVPSNPINKISTIPDCTASPLNLQGNKCTLSIRVT